MIVGLSTIQDQGAGFRSRLFLPRWNAAQQLLRSISHREFDALRVRMTIGNVDLAREVKGFEEARELVVENRVPIEQFKKLSIREKNDLVLDAIFESLNAAYAHFGETPPTEIDRIWQEVRAAP